MRIALIGPTYPFRGGIAHYTTCLNEELRQRHETLLISFSRQYPGLLFPGRTQEDSSSRYLSTPSEPILNPFSPRSWRAVARRLRQFSPRVVVFQWWQSILWPRLLVYHETTWPGAPHRSTLPLPQCFPPRDTPVSRILVACQTADLSGVSESRRVSCPLRRTVNSGERVQSRDHGSSNLSSCLRLLQRTR